MKRNRIMIAVLLLAVAIVGNWSAPALIASEEHEETHGHEGMGVDATFELIMGEFYFQVEGQPAGEPLVLTAGQRVRLEIRNEGQIFHEAMFGITLNGDHGYVENFFEHVGVNLEHEMHMNEAPRTMGIEVEGLEEVELDSDLSVALEFTVPENYAGLAFEIGCFVPGHYAAGMRLPLVVKAAEMDDDHGDHDHAEAIADADGDGVPDADDYCPTFPGTPLKNGC